MPPCGWQQDKAPRGANFGEEFSPWPTVSFVIRSTEIHPEFFHLLPSSSSLYRTTNNYWQFEKGFWGKGCFFYNFVGCKRINSMKFSSLLN